MRRNSLTFGMTTLLGLAAGLASCDKSQDSPEHDKPVVKQPLPDVEAIVEKPSSFYGKKVTLLGEVDTVFSSRAFELEGTDWIFDHEILVVARSPIRLGPTPLEDDDEIVVSGTVRRMTRTELEREIGWDSKVEIEVEIEDYPIIIADSIHSAKYVARWSESDDRDGVILGDAVPLATRVAESLVGHRIDFDVITVQSTAGTGLWIGSNHRMQTFVNPPPGFDASTVAPGDRIEMSGVFRMMPPTDVAVTRWAFDPSLRAQIDEELVYIDATTLNKLPEPPPRKVTLAQVLATPERHAGRLVSGQTKVTSVPSDRGFWLDVGEDQKIFAVIHEKDPQNNRIDINPGDTVKFSGLALMPERSADLLLPLEDDAKAAINKSGVFINIHWSDIEKVEAA